MQVSEVFTSGMSRTDGGRRGDHDHDRDDRRGHHEHHRGHWNWDRRYNRRSWCWDD
ncbi:MAG: hypothetical protein QOH09_1313 [Pseudonocardiales bacterium]|nr:hypothetical protein [Pseudonocardiales bacterium]